MNWTIYGIECAVSVALFTGAIMIPLCRNPVWWIHDYPADIQEKYFETHERIHAETLSAPVLLKKGFALLLCVAVFVGLALLAGAKGFKTAFLASYGLWFVVDWYDCFFLDWVAAEYIKFGGMEAYQQFKQKLMGEINALLATQGIRVIVGLFELVGEYVNLEYLMPSGEKVKLLNDKNIYLGAQIEFTDLGICYGVVADTGFILNCSYSVNYSEPELIIYRKR